MREVRLEELTIDQLESFIDWLDGLSVPREHNGYIVKHWDVKGAYDAYCRATEMLSRRKEEERTQDLLNDWYWAFEAEKEVDEE